MTHSIEQSWPDALRPAKIVCRDAVVVVPGIMGSELVDTESGDRLWGLSPRWYARAWSHRDGLARLAVTEAELAGKTDRVRPAGLLKFPAIAPVLAGVEPYTRLMKAVREIVAHPDAALGFAYDWRLAVDFNAKLLATAAADHLERWRARSGYSDAGLVLIAHSMGGLLCRAIPLDAGLADVTRAVVTLGTPFDGAAKAAVLLNQGNGAPLPAKRLQRLAATMPGIHALLPMYSCVDEGDSVRSLTPADVGRLGGSAELAAAAYATHRSARPMTGHRALIGIRQSTMSTLTIRDGIVEAHDYTFVPQADGDVARRPNGLIHRVYGAGDGTVPRNSARPPQGAAMPLAQQHGALARSKEAIDLVRDVLTNLDGDLGPRLGADDEAGIGLAMPDSTVPGTPWTAVVTGVRPGQARCKLVNADTNQVIGRPRLKRSGEAVVAEVVLPAPGMYRLSVAGGGTSPVSQLVLAVAATVEE
ncbi:lecithin:cholesterol acyltransferase [Kribbella rubisoli]|uniref:Lecithin:cholesterol acyltransferase n=1 Tax=Kribbella rubisoli TaxID=3075929 RepID=A0A4Q7WZL3_9ACTN|nr:hypothetical protein [Kribbella rubisoli]RZU15991.1 lecithin:cholesterol acyltransferase [Kribbella rubisoli]